jgi:uncharacterized protein
VTIADASTPERDLQSARNAAIKHNLEHIVIAYEILPGVRKNERDRCYHCKHHLFRMLDGIGVKEGLAAILDGENSSDSDDDRPGSRAAREMGILSPLAEAGLTKNDVRELANVMGIEEWDRPASACLCSRVPFGTEIDDAILRRIDITEDFIRSKGISTVRARVEGRGIRLELGQDENTEENRALVEALVPEIARLGWERVQIDKGGYVPAGLRTGKHEK